ncbi:MAG TPA: hypothetical protein VFT90_16990 [Chryseosolibacter sp.]|nr:hypothetical protein [Chryseosolibacter sp.]
MTQITIVIIVLAATVRCSTIGSTRTWTVPEAKAWYQQHYVTPREQSWSFVSPLYYRGSDDQFHFFVSRYFDDWVFIKIEIDELTIFDIRPRWKYSNENRGSIGYYPVDPLNDFKKLKMITSEGQQ